MVTSKCFFLVLFFSVALSFGLLCSASDHRRRSEDPRRRYHECQRRCQWETRGEREQDLCEERCERQFRQEQRERQEEEGRRYRHDSNPEDPQRRFEECQQWCEQQGQRQQPQCQQQCRREFEEQREQQEERSHRRHDSNPEDPQRRFEECQQWCEQQGQRQQPQCQQQCRREFEEQREQQEERSHRRHDSNPEDPQRRFEECQQRCEQQGQRQQPQCQQQCQREFQQQREQTQRQLQECQQQCQQEEQRPERKQQCVRQCREKFEQQPNRRDWEEEEEEDEREEWRQNPNPYYFPRRKFAQARFQEDNGNFWVLQKFSQKHHLLKGINEYRVALIEAHPNTFVLPHHCDAEKIYIVTNGKGTITFVTHKNKESFNVVPGVVVRVPAGSTVYLVNQDNKEKLTIAVLHRPVNNPGQFEEFFPAGQEQPQSYYRSFSREILEAVFNTPSEQLEKLFHGRQSQKGMFRRASQEQIKSLSQGATTPKEKEERFAFNLLAQKPKYSNQNGKFFEACPREFELLRNADAAVVGFEINQGSIFVPHYNSKSTFVVVITEGKGHVEMVCPHLSSQSSREEEEDERRSGEYRKVGAEVLPGDVFVVPAGHPVTYVASQNHNLRALAFGLYHQNSTRIFIAGKNNMVRQMDSAAKEISFGVPSKLIDEVFNNNPQGSYFVSREGQKQRGSEESRDNPISSILDFARFF
ncbi:hypothetical protein HRI_000864800 [Hibiscus trionum]|uniref:Cupin type-1 domain-containing protein n=1 Tax=Hibiscus trionum TaxID=183268 RepID=A0A9W7H6N2_HIBTR|nr:hypothetical protein HRI_000864800 [Hibiscus trionum]